MTVKTQPNPLDLMTAGASKASLGSVISPKKLSELQWKKKKKSWNYKHSRYVYLKIHG